MVFGNFFDFLSIWGPVKQLPLDRGPVPVPGTVGTGPQTEKNTTYIFFCFLF